MAKKKETTKQKADFGQTVTYGDVTFQVEKSDSHFAVKKRIGARLGELSAARANAEVFPQLALSMEHSTRDIEVYQVSTDSIETAMAKLRDHGEDVEWCGHVYHTVGDLKGLMVPQDSLYVEVEPNTDPLVINDLLMEHALEFVSQDKDDPNVMILRLTSASTENPIKIANRLLENDQVKAAEPSFSTAISYKAHRPADPLFVDQWHLENRGGLALTTGADVSAPAAWDITRGDRSIVICIMDDGVDTGHVDFSSPGKILAPAISARTTPTRRRSATGAARRATTMARPVPVWLRQTRMASV